LHLRLTWINGTFGALFEPVETDKRLLEALPQGASPN